MTRVAAVDLGTNSTRLIVADVEGERLDELERLLTITRLGEGVDTRGRLLPVAIARVRNCLSDYRRAAEARGAERTLAIATSAVRDAKNGEAFLGEIEWSYGFETRLLSGDEEALLTFRGVTAGRVLEPGTLIVDVGGGSTELIEGGPGGVGFHTSLDVGCVRLTERFLPGDPPGAEATTALGAAVRSLLAERVPDEVRARMRSVVGVAGTVSTLAMLDLGLAAYDRGRVHGHRIAAGSVDEQLARLAALRLEERRRVRGLERERAPVIVAGVAIVREVLAYFGANGLEDSECDILDGAALAAAELPAQAEGEAPPGAYTCC